MVQAIVENRKQYNIELKEALENAKHSSEDSEMGFQESDLDFDEVMMVIDEITHQQNTLNQPHLRIRQPFDNRVNT